MGKPLQWFPHKYADNAHPLVKALCDEMNRQRVPANMVATRAGVTANAISKWKRNKRIFDINSIEACFNVLGFTLKPVRKKDNV